MRTRKDIVLGIEFAADQIRLVEVQGRASSPQILHASIAPMPEGAIGSKGIVEPEAVGIALRRLVESSGVTTRDAVFGLASGSVNTQVMNVPIVPEQELQTVLEGELEHYKIMKHGESAFDYLRLNTPNASADATAGGETPMLLMAADKNIIRVYQSVAEMAGLNLVSLEPTLLAMYRVGWMLAKEQPGALCLSVDHIRSELAFIDDGEIRLYRRIDVGSEALFPSLYPNSANNATAAARPRAAILGEEEDAGLSLSGLNVGLPGSQTNPGAARAIATEVRRSIEYYRREHPNQAEGDIVMVADTPAMEAMQPLLQEELRRGVTLVRPNLLRGLNGVNILQAPTPRDTESAEEPELALIAALGLALGLLPDLPAGMPRFNLTSAHRQSALANAARRALTVSAAASVALLLFGGIVAGLVHVRANAAERDLNKLQADYTAEQQKQNLIVSKWQRQQNQLAALEKKGFPFPRLMDAISSVVPVQSGLTEVSLSPVGRLSVMGNAANDQAVLQTLDGLRSVNWFVFPTLDSQERKQDRPELPPRVEFKISTQLADAAPPASTSGVNP